MLPNEELKKWARNIIMFTAPAVAILFLQLSQGVEIEKALPVAVLALYGLIADYLKKLNQ